MPTVLLPRHKKIEVVNYINGNNYNFDYEFKINLETISIKEVCDIFLKIDRLIHKDLLKKL